MKLEDEIKQRTFNSEYHKLLVNILFTANWLKAKENKFFRQYCVSMQQYNVLRILKGQHPKPASLLLIRERMLDKESNASRLVDKLCSNGYTRRIQCPEDRRQVDISISDKGLSLLAELKPVVDNIDNAIGSISEIDAKKMNVLLDQLRS